MSISFDPPQPSEPKPPAWWPIDRWAKKWKVVGLIVATVLVVGLFVGAQNSDEKSKADGPKDYSRNPWGTELCESLRSERDRKLTRGDYMRMLDMTDYEIQRYVLARCPDQYDRVD